MVGNCNCTLKDGIHDSWCESNNEYEYYRCPKCGRGVPMFEFSEGMCQKCRDNRPMTLIKIIAGDNSYDIKIPKEDVPAFVRFMNTKKEENKQND